MILKTSADSEQVPVRGPSLLGWGKPHSKTVQMKICSDLLLPDGPEVLLNRWTGSVDSGLKPTMETFHKVTGARVVRVLHHNGGVVVQKLVRKLRRGSWTFWSGLPQTAVLKIINNS